MIRITVRAEVRPTEDEEKVKRAVLAVFEPEVLRVVKRGDRKFIVAESTTHRSLLKLHELLRRERILDAARSILKSSTSGNIIVFHVHKQAALQGRLSFTEPIGESPLGPITFTIETDKPGDLIDWLAPKTRRGKPLWEREMPED